MHYLKLVLVLASLAIGYNTKEYFVVKNFSDGKDLHLFKPQKGLRFYNPIREPRVNPKAEYIDSIDYRTYTDSIYIVDGGSIFYKLYVTAEASEDTAHLADTVISGIAFQYYFNPDPVGYDTAGKEFRCYSLIVREYEGIPVYHHFVLKWAYYLTPSRFIWEMLAKAKLE